jgi:hypothetical protein
MLKHMVELQNPQLCFVKQKDANTNNERTIFWCRALQIVRDSSILKEEVGFFEELELFLKMFSNKRNEIVHFEFEYETSQMRSLIVMVITKLRKLYTSFTGKDFIDDVSDDTKKTLETIENEHQRELHLAQADAKEKAEENGTHCEDCNLCGGSKTAVLCEDGEMYCYLCEESDYIVDCCRCKEGYKISEMEYCGEAENGDNLFICQHCYKSLLDSDGGAEVTDTFLPSTKQPTL